MWSVCSNWSAATIFLRAATITFKVLFEGGYYSRAASDRGNTVVMFPIGQIDGSLLDWTSRLDFNFHFVS